MGRKIAILLVILIPISCFGQLNAEYYFEQGNTKSSMADFNGAIQDYTKAVELNTNYPEAYSTRGYAKSILEDYKGAIHDCSKSIELNPNHAFAYSIRGYSKSELNVILPISCTRRFEY